MKRTPVAILGATGTVGQKFITLLQDHPQFEIVELVASPRSAGKPYHEATSWKQNVPIPASVATMTVQDTSSTLTAPLLFSGLDSSVAGEAEDRYSKAGHVVISNSSNYRMAPDVPLVIPEINPDHFELIHRQGRSGAIITNSNCSTMFLAMALAPLYRTYGIEWVQVTTLQAISGAGYPGVPSLDILGNVIPFIGGEEEKVEQEAQKILGTLTEKGITPAPFRVSATCTRVPVVDGHLETVTVKFPQGVDPSPEEVIQTLSSWRGLPQEMNLPSAPGQPLVVLPDQDRPQPARDIWCNGGMSTVIGRVRRDTIGNIRMVILGHNTVRGAAGAAVLNAEALLAQGLLDDRL
ncbi:aspartate semialdehyde dehydrogenase [Alkalispirochaeta americana]|uniref:Aspartate-semialdehyde dehydrogenase n=1 Tax=Alkalispirochaeta americana TaxID=159291 RepID=A0A1N6UX51_9SPIO|nr:aspartate-semialdehyde dehydrogenase [Alkalispirochaeta americana]SIQ70121.1 aspartate semialdehyde dehydrogenase [Alkalispirochaeta americana]